MGRAFSTKAKRNGKLQDEDKEQDHATSGVPRASKALVGPELPFGLDQVIAPAGVPRARSSVFVGPSSMALQGELSESLLLPHEITKVNKAYRSHAGPTKNFRDSRLRLPPHGQRLYLSAIGLPSSRLRGVRHIRHVCELGLRPPPLRQARAARGKGADAPSACWIRGASRQELKIPLRTILLDSMA